MKPFLDKFHQEVVRSTKAKRKTLTTSVAPARRTATFLSEFVRGKWPIELVARELVRPSTRYCVKVVQFAVVLRDMRVAWYDRVLFF